MTHVLLLGGTSDASQLARALHGAAVRAVFSYAGATRNPVAQPLPTRSGGFGGAAGLARFIREHGITHVVDATHPFAAQMSRNACEACALTGTPLIALERAPWQAGEGDRWICVPDMEAAALALPVRAAKVFLSVGRKQLGAFAAQRQHRYLLRMVDAPGPGELPLDGATVLVERGPFSAAHDRALLEAHGIEWLVTKNAGGEATRGKLDAARDLGLTVVMVQRPALPQRLRTGSAGEVLHWIAHGALPAAAGAGDSRA